MPHDPRWQTTWVGVKPRDLKGWAYCQNWADLDYFIAARASMDHVNIGYQALLAQTAVLDMLVSP